MRFYKLEKVQAALRANGAEVATVVGTRECTEVWQRELSGHKYRAVLAWQATDMTLREDAVTLALHTLFVQPIIDAIRSDEGLWLG